MADQYGNTVDSEVWVPARTERMIGPALTLDPPPAEFTDHLERGHQARMQLENPNFLDGPEHVITGGRQEGKTRLALKWLLEAPEGTDRVLVVVDERTAENLKAHMGWKKNDPRIIHFRRMVNRVARKNVEYGIDDTADILTSLLGLSEYPRLITVGHAAPWQTGALP